MLIMKMAPFGSDVHSSHLQMKNLFFDSVHLKGRVENVPLLHTACTVARFQTPQKGLRNEKKSRKKEATPVVRHQPKAHTTLAQM